MNMAKKNETQAAKKYTVTIKNNAKFCGIGAGGVQFAYGKATVTSERMANWFREHRGYEVAEDAEAADGNQQAE